MAGNGANFNPYSNIQTPFLPQQVIVPFSPSISPTAKDTAYFKVWEKVIGDYTHAHEQSRDRLNHFYKVLFTYSSQRDASESYKLFDVANDELYNELANALQSSQHALVLYYHAINGMNREYGDAQHPENRQYIPTDKMRLIHHNLNAKKAQIVNGENNASRPPPPPQPASKKRAANSEDDRTTTIGDDGAAKPPKKPRAPSQPRKKKAQDSQEGGTAAEEEGADKIKIGGEVIDLQAETDAVMEGLESRRKHHVEKFGTHASIYESGMQYLSAWRLTNELLQQRKEKMPGSDTSTASLDEFLDPAIFRAIQQGFAVHGSDILRRAAQVAKHRASSTAIQRRTEFVPTGDDPRRGIGEIRKAAEKIAEEKEAEERAKLMKMAQSKRADEETREKAQKAKAEMAGKQQAVAANKALAEALGGKEDRWTKWGGGALGGSNKNKEKAATTTAAGAPVLASTTTAEQATATAGDDAGPTAAAEQQQQTKKNLAASRSRADLASGSSLADLSGESADIQLQDVIVVLEQDPLYCKSMLLYRLMNGLNR